MRFPSSLRFRKATWILIALCAMVGGFVISSIVFYLNCYRIVETQLKSQSFSLASKIYAEAPLLKLKMLLPQQKLADYLSGLGYYRVGSAHLISKGGEFAVSPGDVSFQRRRLFLKKQEYSPVSVRFDQNRITKIVDLGRNAEVSAVELEPVAIKNLFGNQMEKRTLLFYSDLPADLIHAVVAIEDRRFYQHHGVDFHAIARAEWSNLHGNKFMQGGSTISQQLVKNFYLTPEKSYRRKLTEAAMSVILETRLSKQKILELYLNEIYLGQDGPTSIHGVGEASRFYFGKDLQHLTLSECALLAGLIQAPGTYNPFRHPEEAIARRNTVLAAMKELDFISKSEDDASAKAPLRLRKQGEEKREAPYFGDLVKTQLLEKFQGDTIYKKNLQIFTTIDLDLQRKAEEALTAGLQDIDRKRFREVHKNVQGCLIAIEPETGYIRAFVGGRSYSKSVFDRISQASRQPGSVFKPVVYATAFEKSFPSQKITTAGLTNAKVYTPATLVNDEPWVLQYSDGIWEPKNYDQQFHGIVTLRTALTYSMNVATARLAVDVGLKDIAEMGKRLGYPNVPVFPSIALGAFQASPWSVAKAFTVFANGGWEANLRSVEKITDAQGNVLESAMPDQKRILHAQTAYLITDMLRSVVTHGTGAPLQGLGFTRPVAGKTGTTDDFRDAWFAGYVPHLLCVVWVGYDDNESLKMNGAEAALPIWAHFMEAATAEMPEENFPIPQGLVVRKIDPYTGELATPNCPTQISEIFISGTEPRQYCDQHGGLNYAGDLPLQPRTFVWNSSTGTYEQIQRPAVRKNGSGSKGFLKKLKKLKFW